MTPNQLNQGIGEVFFYQKEFTLCMRSMSRWVSIDIRLTVSPTEMGSNAF